eukprot:gene3808-4738_t
MDDYKSNNEPPFINYRDKTEEFKQKKEQYAIKNNNELDNIILKFKQVSLNVSTVLNTDIESKLIHNCISCGTTFGRIFAKKQQCIICGSVVCSNCNQNPIPLNAFGNLNNRSLNNQNNQPQVVNTCRLCYQTLQKAIKLKETQRLKDQSENSPFVQFYEQMQLNIFDLKKKLPIFKSVVDSISDNSSPNIKKAKELESIVGIHIKELEVGIKKLKDLKGRSLKETTVISNMKICFADYLQTSIPDYRIYSSQLAKKLQTPPPAQPTTPPHPPTTTTTTSSTPISITSPLSSSNNSNNNIESTSPTNYSIGNIGGDPNQSTIQSVGPAICPQNGSLVTITGDNLDKPGIRVLISGAEMKLLKQNNSAIMFLSPPQPNEGEVELVIKDSNQILSKQNLFYTNSCFQTNEDISKVNDYALEELASSGNNFDDLVIEMVHPTVCPLNGTRISVQLKNPVHQSLLISVGSIPIANKEISSGGRKVSFQSPPLQEGCYSIEFTMGDKYLEVPNILFYESKQRNDDYPLPSAEFKSFRQQQQQQQQPQTSLGFSNPTIATTGTNQQPITKSSTRVWGKKN